MPPSNLFEALFELEHGVFGISSALSISGK
jgi:hypothetical protein